MMEKCSLKPTSIRNILTLRYDPEKDSNLKKLRFQDFKEIEYKDKISEKIEALLKNEIKYRIGNANNIAVPIGSGIDSAVILCLAKEVFPNKNIFGISLGFGDRQDETKAAKTICNAIGTDCHTITVENVLRNLPRQIRIVGEPRWNLWYFYVLEQAANHGAELMLSGDGGDELFGGYTFRYSKYLGLIKSDFQLPTFLHIEDDPKWIKRAWCYMQCHERDWVPDQESIFSEKLSDIFSWHAIMQYLEPYFDNRITDPLSQVLLADFNGKLIHDWIPTDIALSKYFSLQTISPFVSESIMEFVPHLSIEKKYNQRNNEGKLILREILEKREILDLVSKTKLGFGMDLVNLWNKHGKKISENFLADPITCKEQWINRAWIEQTINNLGNDKDPRYINKVLQLLSFELWYRIFVTSDLPLGTTLDG